MVEDLLQWLKNGRLANDLREREQIEFSQWSHPGGGEREPSTGYPRGAGIDCRGSLHWCTGWTDWSRGHHTQVTEE